jgi:hypothetical protein
MRTVIVLSLMLSLARPGWCEPPPLAYALGRLLIDGPPREDDWLYRCADLHACAGECAAVLKMLADPMVEEPPTCPAMAGVMKTATDWTSRQRAGVAWARARFRGLAERVGRTEDVLTQDLAACYLAVVEQGPPAEKACVRAEARILTDTLRTEPPPLSDELLAQVCGELTTCAAGCWLRTSRHRSGQACEAIARRDGESVDAWEERFAKWGRDRLAAFVQRAAPSLSADAQHDLLCGAARHKLASSPADCAPIPPPPTQRSKLFGIKRPPN